MKLGYLYWYLILIQICGRVLVRVTNVPIPQHRHRLYIDVLNNLVESVFAIQWNCRRSLHVVEKHDEICSSSTSISVENYLWCVIDSLHGSIVEGSEPDGRREQVDGDHHLPVLLEGPLEPLHQADGLILQGVHVCRVAAAAALLTLLLVRLSGRRQPTATTGARRWWRWTQGAAAEQGGRRRCRDPHQQGSHCRQALQSAAVQDALHHGLRRRLPPLFRCDFQPQTGRRKGL